MIRLMVGDCRETLPTAEPASVQACITSPPYYGLRDYGSPPLVWGGDSGHEHAFGLQGVKRRSNRDDGFNQRWNENWAGGGAQVEARPLELQQGAFCPCGAWLGSLGLEPTPELYIEHLVEVFRHVRRVLSDRGVLWCNLGDSYAGSGRGTPGRNAIGNQIVRQGFNGDTDPHGLRKNKTDAPAGYKSKDLMMMPFRVAMALQADGWWLRSVIPWLKRNSMPESVTDRPASAIEYVFLLSKSRTYFWDAGAVRVPQGNNTVVPGGRSRRNTDWFFESWQGLMLDEQDDPVALVVNPTGYKGAHYATFPPKLVEPMVKASTSEKGQCSECGAPWVRVTEKTTNGRVRDRATGGLGTAVRREPLGMAPVDGAFQEGVSYTTAGWRASCAHSEGSGMPQMVLDPFAGSGTVGMVADRLNRNAILCELKPSYGDQATARVVGDAPLFVEMT